MMDSTSKKVVFRLDTHKIKDLKRIAVEIERTQASLFVEGVDYILKKYNQQKVRGGVVR